MKKKFLAIGIIGVLMASMLTGCDYEENVSSEKAYTAEIKQQIFDMYGMPNISNGYEYAQLKEIYELRDDPNLICYWYTKNDMTGKFVYQGKCVGYGIPYSASLTAPEIPDYSSYEDNAVLMQAEPNGIYTNGVTSSATWILTVDEDGNIKPTYVENEITVTQIKMDSRLCEDWSLTDDYEKMSDKAEISGEVDTTVLEDVKEEVETTEDTEDVTEE